MHIIQQKDDNSASPDSGGSMDAAMGRRISPRKLMSASHSAKAMVQDMEDQLRGLSEKEYKRLRRYE